MMTDLVVGIQLPVLDEPPDERHVPLRVERRGVIDDVPDAHPGIERDDLRHVPEPRLGTGGERPRRLAEQRDGSGVGSDQAQRGFEQRRFPRAVLPQ